MSQQEVVDTEIEFIAREKDQLDDVIYENGSAHSKLENAKIFDYFEIIFVAGDANMHPWSRSNRKVCQPPGLRLYVTELCS